MDSGNAQHTTMSIKHMLYCRFLKCVLLNFVSNVRGQDTQIIGGQSIADF